MGEEQLFGSTDVLGDLKSRIKNVSGEMGKVNERYRNANKEYKQLMDIESSVNGKLNPEELSKTFSTYMRKGNSGLRERVQGLESFISKYDATAKFINTDNGIVNIDAANQVLNTPNSLFRVKLIGGVLAGFVGLRKGLPGALAAGYIGYHAAEPVNLLKAIEAGRGAVSSVKSNVRNVQSLIPRQTGSTASAIIRANSENTGEE